MTVNNRPEYLRQVLNALLKCTIPIDQEYILLPSVEPPVDEIRHILESIKLPHCLPYYHSTRQGCNKNTYHAINRGFNFSDKVIHLEDDLLPFEDFLMFNTRLLEQYKYDEDTMAIGSWNDPNKSSYDCNLILRKILFCSWGVATWKNSWLKFQQKFLDISTTTQPAWDTALGIYFQQNKWYSIIPNVNRVRNIGRLNGTYMTPAGWDNIGVRPGSQDEIKKMYTYKE